MRWAAQGDLIHQDDTVMKILDRPDLRQIGKKLRKGVYTTGLISKFGKNRVALFITGMQHAGENLDTIVAHCLAHARRKLLAQLYSMFVAVEFPPKPLGGSTGRVSHRDGFRSGMTWNQSCFLLIGSSSGHRRSPAPGDRRGSYSCLYWGSIPPALGATMFHLPRTTPALLHPAALLAAVLAAPCAQAAWTFAQEAPLGVDLPDQPIALASLTDEDLFVLVRACRDPHGKDAWAPSAVAPLFHLRPDHRGRWEKTLVAELPADIQGMAQGPGNSLLLLGSGDAFLLQLAAEDGRIWKPQDQVLALDRTAIDPLNLEGAPSDGIAAGPDGRVYEAQAGGIQCWSRAGGQLSREAFAAETAGYGRASSLAVDDRGVVYRVDRARSAFLRYAPGCGDVLEASLDWGIPGFRPRKVAAFHGRIVVAGTTPGAPLHWSLAVLTPGPSRGVSMGTPAPLGVRLAKDAPFCLSPGGHLFHARPGRAGVSLLRRMAAAAGEAKDSLPAPALAESASQAALPAPAEATRAGKAEPPRPPQHRLLLSPVEKRLKAAHAAALARHASGALAGFLAAWLQDGQRPPVLARQLAAAGPAIPDPPLVRPNAGPDRFTLTLPALGRAAHWMLQHALRDGRELDSLAWSGADAASDAFPGISLSRNKVHNTVYLEVRNLARYAEEIDAPFGDGLVAGELRKSRNITGVRTYHRPGTLWCDGLTLVLDPACRRILALNASGMVLAGRPRAEVQAGAGNPAGVGNSRGGYREGDAKDVCILPPPAAGGTPGPRSPLSGIPSPWSQPASPAPELSPRPGATGEGPVHGPGRQAGGTDPGQGLTPDCIKY